VLGLARQSTVDQLARNLADSQREVKALQGDLEHAREERETLGARLRQMSTELATSRKELEAVRAARLVEEAEATAALERTTALWEAARAAQAKLAASLDDERRAAQTDRNVAARALRERQAAVDARAEVLADRARHDRETEESLRREVAAHEATKGRLARLQEAKDTGLRSLRENLGAKLAEYERQFGALA
jgi:flagellar hook-length control protein FliK